MISLRGLRRKVKSVKSIQQITRAMKMVSSIRLKHARATLSAAGPFDEQMNALICALYANVREHYGASGQAPVIHPLMEAGKRNKTILTVITGDRGLAGGYNANIIRKAAEAVNAADNREIAVVTIGKKGRSAFLHRKITPVKEYVDVLPALTYKSAAAIGEELAGLYLSEQASELLIVHAAFKSIMSQPVVIEKLLPVSYGVPPPAQEKGDCLFEPAAEKLLAMLIPYFFKTRLYRIMLESLTAEHAARMTAMDAATNNADEVIQTLTRNVNRIRQEKITQELAELIASQ